MHEITVNVKLLELLVIVILLVLQRSDQLFVFVRVYVNLCTVTVHD